MSLSLGSWGGTQVRLHFTFLLFLGFIAWTGYTQGGPAAAWDGLLFITLLFACVLLHEFGHVLAGRRYGVHTPDVILLPIGGVARMRRLPRHPGQELVIALAGPAVNVAIAAALWLWLGAAPADPDPLRPGLGLAERLLVANLVLVAFNLIPAFPMDGGRALRALLAMRLPWGRATAIAATLGQALATLAGVYAAATGQLLLGLVALFVFLGAAAERKAARRPPSALDFGRAR